jgi:hypothetical protein
VDREGVSPVPGPFFILSTYVETTEQGDAPQDRVRGGDAAVGGLARFRVGSGGEDLDQPVQRVLRRQGEEADDDAPDELLRVEHRLLAPQQAQAVIVKGQLTAGP